MQNVSQNRGPLRWRRAVSAVGLVLALVTFGSAARGQIISGPRLSDEALLAAFDLDHPALADARDVIGGADRKAALAALVKVLRTYEQPIDFGQNLRPDPRRRSPGASDAMRGLYIILDISHTFEDKNIIDWDFNPTTVEGSTHAADSDWTRHLNRHSTWAGMAILFQNSKRKATAFPEIFTRQFRSWVAVKPVPTDGEATDPYSAWMPLDAGIRMAATWPTTWTIFRSCDAVPDEVIVNMAKSLIEHGRYLIEHPGKNSELTTTMNGLYRLSALLPMLRESEKWRKVAGDRIIAALEKQIYPDGSHIELSPRHLIRALGNFIGVLKVAREGRYELPDAPFKRLDRMFDYLLWSSRPDATTPEWNESTSIHLRSVLQQALAHDKTREDIRWLLAGGRAGRAPDHLSDVFPYAGHVYMRSGWRPQSLYLAFDAGPLGTGIQHEDKLSIVVHAYGRAMVVEAGSVAQGDSPWREYVRSSVAHNVVLVDGQGQARRGASETYRAGEPDRMGFRTTTAEDFARGHYRDGFGTPDNKPATHFREVLFLKEPAVFVVRDTLTPLDGKPHRYDALFHLAAPAGIVDEAALAVDTTFANGPQMRVIGMRQEGLSVRVLSGKQEPALQSFRIGGTARRDATAIPTAVYSIKSDQMVKLVTVLQPTPDPKRASTEAQQRLLERIIEIRKVTDEPDSYELVYETGRLITARFTP